MIGHKPNFGKKCKNAPFLGSGSKGPMAWNQLFQAQFLGNFQEFFAVFCFFFGILRENEGLIQAVSDRDM